MLLRDSFGRSLSLGDQVGKGGQGVVHRIVGDPRLLAKIYRTEVTPELRKKFEVLTSMRSSDLDKHAAWPRGLVMDAAGRCRGLLIPWVDAPSIVDRLAHPGEQRLAWPAISYAFLVHVSLNVMRAAEAIHRAGCVIADVNDGNIMVLSDGTVRFIDVDSFQVDRGGTRHRCSVGTPLYTPPELQNRDFAAVDRLVQHDAFGLAVLVFQLLMHGCHPFSGVPRGAAGGSLEEAIAQGLYAHTSRRDRRVDPPPGRWSIEALGPLAPLFERAFSEGPRPLPKEWIDAIERLQRSLDQCQSNARHWFRRELGRCPFCQLGVDPFPALLHPKGTGSIRLDELLSSAKSVPRPESLNEAATGREPPLRGDESTPPLVPDRVLAMRMPPARDVSIAIVSVALFAVALVAAFLGVSESPPLLVVSGVCLLASIFSGLVWLRSNREHQRKLKAVVTERNRVLAEIDPKCSELRRDLEFLARTLSESGAKIQTDVESSRAELGRLHSILGKAISEVETVRTRLDGIRNNSAREFRDHVVGQALMRATIRNASIQGIGPSRKAALQSFGIHNAADLDRRRVVAVPGIGTELGSRLLEWRQGIEMRASPAPGTLPPNDWLQSRLREVEADARPLLDRLSTHTREYRSLHLEASDRLRSKASERDEWTRLYRATLAQFRSL